jgi:hypothetical protein
MSRSPRDQSRPNSGGVDPWCNRSASRSVQKNIATTFLLPAVVAAFRYLSTAEDGRHSIPMR